MIQGILCVLGASLIFGINPTGNKYVMLSGVSPMCLTFYSAAILTLICLVLVKAKSYSLKIKWKDALYLGFLGSIGMGITSALISLAMESIPVGLATILHFLYPTLVSIAMVVFFRQKLTRWKLLAIACSIFGMLLITDLSGSGAISLVGILLALCSSLTYSFYIIANDKGSVNQHPLLVKLVYSGLGSSLLFGTITVARGEVSLPGTTPAWVVMVACCGFGYMAAFYLINAGIKRIGASAASFVNMLEPVTSVVVSTLIYHYALEGRTILGMVLILSSVFLVAMDGREKNTPTTNS